MNVNQMREIFLSDPERVMSARILINLIGSRYGVDFPPMLHESVTRQLASFGVPERVAEACVLGRSSSEYRNLTHMFYAVERGEEEPDLDLFTACIVYLPDTATQATRITPNSPLYPCIEVLADIAATDDVTCLSDFLVDILVNSPCTSPEVLANIARQREEALDLAMFAQHPNLPVPLAEAIADSRNGAAITSLASNRSISATCFSKIIGYVQSLNLQARSYGVEMNTARHIVDRLTANPALPTSALVDLIPVVRITEDGRESNTWTALVSHPNADADVISKAWVILCANGEPSAKIAASFLMNPMLSPAHETQCLGVLRSTLQTYGGGYWGYDYIAKGIASARSIPYSTWLSFMKHSRAEIRAAAAANTPEEGYAYLLESATPLSLLSAFCRNEGFREWLEQHESSKTRARVVRLARDAEESDFWNDGIPGVEDYASHEDESIRAAVARYADDSGLLLTLAADPSEKVRLAAGRRLRKVLVAA